MKKLSFILVGLCSLIGCKTSNNEGASVKPIYVTETVNHDSDDPAIWIHPKDPAKSLILGTDKMENEKGGLFVFTLDGKIDTVIAGLDRPNNVDIAHGFKVGDKTIDLAFVTERQKARIRVLAIPSMEFKDGGGIPVFEDDSTNAVMGVAVYHDKRSETFYAIVSRKENSNHQKDYLYQYKIVSDSSLIRGELVRKFGDFSGVGEIEAIAVDNELGYVYYSDEGHSIRKYYADPSKGNEELAVFGLENFVEDREGISIYKSPGGKGYILVSDQQGNEFHVYPRTGADQNPHSHPLLAEIKVSTLDSDGSEVTSIDLGGKFKRGLFVAMSDDRTFQIYSWSSIAEQIGE